MANRRGIEILFLTNDIFSTANVPCYAGLISNAGILLWAMGGAVCLFTSWGIVRREGWGRARFLTVSGLVTFYAMVDDALLFHEWLIPQYLEVPQPVTMGLYGLVVVGYLWFFRKEILRTDYLLLGAALFFLNCSITLDQIADLAIAQTQRQLVVEESLKLLGIVTWVAYFAHECMRQLGEPGEEGSR